jgi:ADP-dependent NAD(P)H-hydrate dehydratase
LPRVADGPEAEPLDSTWLAKHPLPLPDHDTDKNARGRVMAIGGCLSVPGGLLLCAEGALRAGAGKVQLATVAESALALGVAMPEARVFALATDPAGEIAALNEAVLQALEPCDAVLLGPAMLDPAAAGRLLDQVLDADPSGTLVLDAAALISLGDRAARLGKRAAPAILTPHPGEMAALVDRESVSIADDPVGAVRAAAQRFGSVVVLKGARSFIAAPDGTLLAYTGGGVGLATGGSGDVLAGIAAGFAARGADPLVATAWAVWAHGEAGRRCAEQIGPLGFLARDLLGQVPGLLRVH